MTRKQLKRGKELEDLMDRLWSKKKRLEELKALCSENVDIAKKTTHVFCIKTFGNDSGDSDMLEVTANAAYLGVCSDIKEIENELEKLDKEFTDL